MNYNTLIPTFVFVLMTVTALVQAAQGQRLGSEVAGKLFISQEGLNDANIVEVLAPVDARHALSFCISASDTSKLA